MCRFFVKFRNSLQIIVNCTFIYTTTCNTLSFTLPMLEMHMCIYMYQQEIRCFGTLLSLSSIIPSIIHKHAHVHFCHFFDKFRNSLHILDNCTFIYTTICNTLLFTLPILEMHMCIYMYQHEIRCFGTLL